MNVDTPASERKKVRVGIAAVGVIILTAALLVVFSASARRFVTMGVEHILTGYDHLAFLVMLMVATKRLGDLVWIVSSFTVAHSLTLTAASLGWIVPNPSLVEPLIALTILYVAVENWFTAEPKARIALTFGFGLIHGLGFASALSEGPLTHSEELTALLGFNLGVELGQLLFLSVSYPVWRLLANRRPIAARRTFAAVVFGLCLFWLWQRLRAL